MAISTEGGRILFYCPSTVDTGAESDVKIPLPTCQPSAQLGGRAIGVQGRIKDFEWLTTLTDDENVEHQIFVTCGSNGTVSIWRVSHEEMMSIEPADPLLEPMPNQNELVQAANGNVEHQKRNSSKASIRQIGRLLGSYETNERVTCLKAFVMQEANESSGVDEDDGELDFDAHYPDDTPKSDSEEQGATSDESSGEGKS